MNAIPTLYQGVQFRSRLEAKWAAFFDLLGWKWEYEPFDLDGWIPDFLLTEARVLVEVKPVQSFPEDVAAEIDRAIPEEYEALIAGCIFPVPQTWNKSIDPVTGNQCDESMVVETADGSPVGWMLGRPASWQPKIRPTWGLGIIQKFEIRHPPGWEEECKAKSWPCPQWNGWGLFHSHDHYFRSDPGCDPKGELYGFAGNRFFPTTELVFWGADELPRLWRSAANRSQWKGTQSGAFQG